MLHDPTHPLEPPAGSRILLQQWENGLEMTLLAEPMGPLTAVRMVVPAAWLLALVSCCWLPVYAFPLGALIMLGVLTILLACSWLVRIHRERSRAILTVTDERLLVRLTGIYRSWEWSRQEITAIGVWQGLRIHDNEKEVFLALRHSWDELHWVAETLRHVLLVPADLPPAPGELVVRYTGTFWETPVPGLLHVQPGRMALRCSLAEKPHLKFCPDRGPGSNWLSCNWWKALVVQPDDLSCRINDDGSAALRIALPQVVCRVRRNGTASMTLMSLGLLLHLTIELAAGIAQRKKIPLSECDFRLTIWCADGQALSEAVGRFWGAKE